MFEVDYYHLENGRAPAREFIESLDVKMRAKAVAAIDLLCEFGNRLREPYSKPMGEGLFELRVKFSGDIARIFYFFVVDNRIILTNGFVKKTAKAPKGEIELARKYKKDYERRMGDG